MSHVKTRLCPRNEMLSYYVIEKECEFIFHMIHYLCFYLNLCKITELETEVKKLKLQFNLFSIIV